MIFKLYEYLKNEGFEVYFIGQHTGICNTNYIVLKDGGSTSLTGKNGSSTIDVIFYIPKNKFSNSRTFKSAVIESIKEFGELRYTGVETSIVADDDKKALTFSVIYENLRKMEG